MSSLSAGAACVDITPSGPQWLDGYGNRTAPSEGVYQPIGARALALVSGEGSAVLVAAEVLGFDRARAPALKQRIAERAGVAPHEVILAATHTHCAPRVCDMVMPGEVDPAYVAWFEQRCVEAAALARAAAVPARVSFSRARDDRLGVNRRFRTERGAVMRPNPGGSHDRDVDSVWFESAATGETVASMTVAGCHPTCRGGPRIGGDYPGYLCRELEREAGGVALFVLGCAGDVRPWFTDAEGRFRMAEPVEVEEAGTRLAGAVLEARASRAPLPGGGARVRRCELTAPLAAGPGPAALREMAASDPSPLRREWAERALVQAERHGAPRGIRFEVQALLLTPDLGAVFWPGEVVADYALWLKRSVEGTGARRVLACAYANGAVGYVPSRAIYPDGGYEVLGSHHYYNLPAPYAPEVDDLLRQATMRLLSEWGVAGE